MAGMNRTHHGVGGTIGFADPAAKIGFSDAMNQMNARLPMAVRSSAPRFLTSLQK